MAHNRPIFVEETSFDQAMVESLEHALDEFQQGLPEEIPEDLIDALPAEHEKQVEASIEAVATDRIELTQQQLSRGVALALLAGFAMFLVGYMMGTYRIERSSGLIPAVLYSAFFETHTDEAAKMHTGTQKKEYGRFATGEEADILRIELVNKGTSAQVVKRTSYTASGREYVRFCVCEPDSTEQPHEGV